MENLKENVIVGSLATIAVAIAIGVFTLFGGSAPAPVVTQDTDSMIGGRVHNTQETFDAGIAVNGTEVISSARAIKPATLTVGSGGTSLDKIVRTTVTVNPDSLATGAGTSTNVTLTGAVVGDTCMATTVSGDLAGTTSTVGFLTCKVLATNIATVYFKNASTTAYDAGSNVVEVKTFSF